MTPNNCSMLERLEAHLLELDIRPGMNLAIHSRLLSFGRLPGGAETLYNFIRRFVGHGATLVFPAYTLNLGSRDVFDPETTPPYKMGALSNYVWQRSDSVRTKCPMHGHFAIGPSAEDLLQVDPAISIGPGSSFEWMRSNEFHLLLLGCTAQEGATYFHHVEAMVGVPYREWIDVPRQVVGGVNVEAITCRYYGRRKELGYRNDLRQAEERLRSMSGCRTASFGARDSLVAPLSLIDEAIGSMVQSDPYALVRSDDLR